VSISDFSLVEDTVAGNIISSMCFIQQNWMFEGILLNVGQVELVGTDEAYRGRGLIRTHFAWLSDRLKEHNCIISCVQGTPTLYQKLGYHFAVPLKGGIRLQVEQIPEPQPEPELMIRSCNADDLVELVTSYNNTIQNLGIHSVRDLALWRYQEEQDIESEHAYETFVLVRSGKHEGYVRIARHNKSKAITVRELVIKSYPDLQAALAFIRDLALIRECTAVVLQLPASHPAINVASYYGGQSIPSFAWQVHIPDWVKFFGTIKPVLNRRLSASLLKEYSGELGILLSEMQCIIRFEIVGGEISVISQEEGSDQWKMKLTVPLLVALAMGYRARKELESCHLEMQTRDEAKYAIDILFPQTDAFVYESY